MQDGVGVRQASCTAGPGGVWTMAIGKTSAITELCDQFDRESDQGRNMEIYDKLLNDVIVIRQSHASTQTAQLQPGGSRDFVPNHIRNARQPQRLRAYPKN